MSEDDLPTIDPEGEALVYMVVADHIEARIMRGDLPVGSRIPGQLDIAATYGIARMTASRAVRELKERGLVNVVRGKGTYVASDRRTPDENSTDHR